MTNPIIIDSNKCVACGACIKDCPTNCFEMESDKAIYAHDNCFACGHCFAICSVAAIDMAVFATDDLGPFVDMAEMDGKKLLQAIKSRRSVRYFKNKDVEVEKVQMILEAGRYAPTAKNTQNIKFTMLASMQNQIEETCVSLFRKALSVGGVFKKNLSKINIDDNFFFKGAPLVIVISGIDNMDKGIATNYMELMAESLGLGVLISGFTETLINKYPKVRKMVNIPVGYKALGVLVIGYPDVKYHRVPPRKEIDLEVL